MTNEEKIILSPQSAQFLLGGVNFFRQNPQAPDWNNLKKETFLVLVQHLSQLTPEEKESLTDYLGRLEQYLNQIVNQELIAPSLPPNLKELVTALEEFQKQQDADVKPPPEIKAPTIEEWIENLQRTIAPEKTKNLQEKTQSVLEQIVAAPKETLEQIIPPITKAVAINTPSLTNKEINQLSSLEKNEIIKNIYNAALPEIATALVKNNISLSGEQTTKLIDQLTLQTKEPILALSAVPPENRFPSPIEPHKTEGTATPILVKILHPQQTIATIFNRQERQISQALKKDPTLPYTIAPQDEAPLGEQIRSILIVKGINNQTAPLTQSLKQEVQGLVFAVRGISSDVLSQALEQGKICNRPGEEINQIAFLLNYQKDFEEKHPRLAQIFKRFHYHQEILTGVKNDQVLPASPYWLVKSANQQLDQSRRWQFLHQINTVFEKTGLVIRKEVSPYKEIIYNRFSFYINYGWQKVADWWQKTGIGKKIASRAQIGVKKFFENTLGQFKLLGKAGVKKATKEGVKRGVSKAITWIATKFAATKLGTTLGSIAPGIGNAIGAVVGFVIDLGISLFKKGGEFLSKLTGGQTEAEQKIKIALGPFSFLVSPLVLIFIIALGAPIILILLTITSEGSAFLNPEVGGEPIPSLPSVTPQPENHLAEQIIKILYDCGYDSYINKTNQNGVIKCINDSSLTDSQKEKIINNFKGSTSQFSSLQCVAFARAIAEAKGVLLPPCGDAKDFLNCSDIPSERYTNEPKDAFFGVFGGNFGHIGIITAVTTNEAGNKICRFASAWGKPDNQNGGKINIIEYYCDQFDALIKP